MCWTFFENRVLKVTSNFSNLDGGQAIKYLLLRKFDNDSMRCVKYELGKVGQIAIMIKWVTHVECKTNGNFQIFRISLPDLTIWLLIGFGTFIHITSKNYFFSLGSKYHFQLSFNISTGVENSNFYLSISYSFLFFVKPLLCHRFLTIIIFRVFFPNFRFFLQ